MRSRSHYIRQGMRHAAREIAAKTILACPQELLGKTDQRLQAFCHGWFVVKYALQKKEVQQCPQMQPLSQ